jgi:biopolymer transport protein ExbD
MKIRGLKAFEASSQDEEMQMSAMIDIVFLLLIYFILTTTLLRAEADLGISLPGSVAQSIQVRLPDEQIIEIEADGEVALNGMRFDAPDSRQMPQLVSTLVRFRQASEAANNPPMITIQPNAFTEHRRIIDVMNACAAAGIRNVSFGGG